MNKIVKVNLELTLEMDDSYVDSEDSSREIARFVENLASGLTVYPSFGKGMWELGTYVDSRVTSVTVVKEYAFDE